MQKQRLKFSGPVQFCIDFNSFQTYFSGDCRSKRFFTPKILAAITHRTRFYQILGYVDIYKNTRDI